jgi:hypothetical protein
MFKNAKLILLAVAILVAAAIVWAVVGVVVTIVKYLFVLAVILFAVSVVRKLAGKSKTPELAESDSDRELNDAMRQLEEIKRRQLVK